MHGAYIEVDIESASPIIGDVSENRPESKKTLKDRVEEVVQGILDGLAELFPPPPQYVPIPVRSPRYPGRRRR